MTYKVLKSFKVKASDKLIELKEGQEIIIPEEKAVKLVEQGKVIPAPMPEAEQAIPYELAERMAIMGEECEPEQVKPYITNFGVLVIPFNSDPKYHYWKPGGQSICATLKELGRCDLIEKYTHPDYFDGN